MVKNKTTKDYISAVGRRRSSVARVRLYKGKGETVVEGKTPSEYFGGIDPANLWTRPFQVTKTDGKYWASIKVAGGGKKGQLESIIHGISRALALTDSGLRPALKKHSLLTRDDRTRERRKVGMGGKSRRRKQSPRR